MSRSGHRGLDLLYANGSIYNAHTNNHIGIKIIDDKSLAYCSSN